MKIKVCGIRDPETMIALEACGVDFIGHIFYDRSLRYAGDTPANTLRSTEMHGTQRVGVFVNAKADTIRTCVDDYGLDKIQLHGDESPAFCRMVGELCPVIKAIGIRNTGDVKKALAYEGTVDFLLFDTKTHLHGGSGRQFDWNYLDLYDGETPFFLSGGIGPDDVDPIKALRHEMLYAIDINSGFETMPAEKDVGKIKDFVRRFRNNDDGN